MKTWKELKNQLQEDAPLNSAGSSNGPIKGLGKPPEDGPPVKKRKKFAGHEVFEVSSDEYSKCLQGRPKYERWSRRFDMEKLENIDIRTYAHKNPGKSIVIQDVRTGEMTFLRR